MPKSLQPLVDKLLLIGGLTDDQKNKLLSLGNQGPDFNKIEQDAKGYGITSSMLGKGFQQNDLFRDAGAVAGFFDSVKAAGGERPGFG